MKLSIKATAASSALVWGGAVLTVGLANLIRPRYGKEFLQLLASIYPGYHARRTIGDVVVGSGYAVVDGAVGGALCAWLYNRLLPVFEANTLRRAEELGAGSGPAKSAV